MWEYFAYSQKVILKTLTIYISLFGFSANQVFENKKIIHFSCLVNKSIGR